MKPNRRNVWSALALATTGLALLTVMLLPARTRAKVKPTRITSHNNLSHYVLSSPRREVDERKKFAAAISDTNSGAMETTTSGKVATATNRLTTP